MNKSLSGELQPNSNLQSNVYITNLSRLKKRMVASNLSDSTIKAYTRSVAKLLSFHDFIDPKDMEIDDVIDFLSNLVEEHQINWRTQKMYTAGLRYFWSQVRLEPDFAQLIPYPKEKPSLPTLLSREDLTKLFDGCLNPKHRVLFRLLYSSGLRRSEVLSLKIKDVDTADGKCRLRINKGKGGKDRYVPLSIAVRDELREYYKAALPVEYLFNGQIKGEAMSESAVRHAFNAALTKSKLPASITLHTLRHSFATHALEHGMHIKQLQQILGHSSVNTTMIYLHISEVPYTEAFSPLDKWENH